MNSLTHEALLKGWKKYMRSSVPSQDCLPWQGPKIGNPKVKTKNYGYLQIQNIRVYAHRLAYTLFVGPVPNTKVVCHRCNNKECVNSSHLYLGTRGLNALDAGRDGLLPHKLTRDQVELARAEYATGFMSQQALATKYGVGLTTMHFALKRRTHR